jgi:hypothetical protein
MKISEAFPTKYISAADLRRAGTKPDTQFIIKKVELEENLEPKTFKPVKIPIVYFMGQSKGHRLRKSEHKRVVKAFGDDAEQWVNQVVNLHQVGTQVGDGVRMIPAQKGNA